MGVLNEKRCKIVEHSIWYTSHHITHFELIYEPIEPLYQENDFLGVECKFGVMKKTLKYISPLDSIEPCNQVIRGKLRKVNEDAVTLILDYNQYDSTIGGLETWTYMKFNKNDVFRL
jgi:hypothetical protein